MDSNAIVGYLIAFSFFALPTGAVIWFLTSLVGFCVIKARRRKDPARYSDRQQRRWRNSLIASAIVAAILVAMCVGILALLAAAVAHM